MSLHNPNLPDGYRYVQPTETTEMGDRSWSWAFGEWSHHRHIGAHPAPGSVIRKIVGNYKPKTEAGEQW